MKMFRVMGNKLGYGTFVAEEAIPNEKLAQQAAKRLRKKNKELSYFTQEYEESRLDK